MSSDPPEWVHRFAVALVCLTVLLIAAVLGSGQMSELLGVARDLHLGIADQTHWCC